MVERNATLDSELLQLKKIKRDTNISRKEIVVVFYKEQILKKPMEREQKIIAK